MTDQDREEIRMMIEQALTARFGNVAYATTSANPVYPAGAWFTINPNPAFQSYNSVGLNEPCMDYSLGIKVYRCATTCAGLPNCKLKEGKDKVLNDGQKPAS